MNVKGYIKNSLKIITGIGAAQIISIILIPITTRLYSPNDFSLYSSYLYATSIISTILIFRLDNILIPIKFSAKRNSIYSYAIGLYALILSACATLAVGLQVIHPSYTIGIIEYCMLGSLSIAIFQLTIGLQVSNSNYNKINSTRISQSLLLGASQIALGKSALLSSSGLIIGDIISRAIAIYTYIKFTKISHPSIFIKKFHTILNLSKKYFHQGFFSTCATLLSTATLLAPAVIFSIYDTSENSAGYFITAYKILSIPVTLISRSMAQVFLGDFREKSDDFLRGIISKILKINIAVAASICGAAAIASEFSGYFLGNDWSQLSYYIKAILPLTFGQITLLPLVQIFIIKEKNKDLLAWEFWRFIGVHASIFLALYSNKLSEHEIILTYSISILLSYTLLLPKIYKLINHESTQPRSNTTEAE